MGLLQVVSKDAGLAASYVPSDLVAMPSAMTAMGGQLLRREAADAAAAVISDAARLGFDIRVRSAYRSYDEQAATYQYWVNILGEAEAQRQSARPGHSEHELGTTADFTSSSVGYELSSAFGDTDEGRWLRDNAYRYGFVLSYPPGNEEITGYIYEPWHFRYIGVEMARAQVNSGLALVEFLSCLSSHDR